MVLLIIAGVLIVTIVGLLLAPLRFQFAFASSEKTVRVSYLLLSTLIDIGNRNGKVSLAGITVRRFELRRKKKPEKEKVVKPEVKKKRRFHLPKISWRDIKSRWQDFKSVITLIKRFRVKYLNLTITGGFAEPFWTGKLYGLYMAVRGVFPRFMSHVEFRPNFSSPGLKYDGRGLIYIRLYHLVFFASRMLLKRLRNSLNEKFIVRKKGASYA